MHTRGDTTTNPAAAARQRLDDLHAAARAALLALTAAARPPESVTAVLADLDATGPKPTADPRHRGAGRRRPNDTAAGVAIAHLMLAGPPGDPDPAITDWLIDAAAHRDETSPMLLLHRWKNTSPDLHGALLKRLTPHLTLTRQLRYSTSATTPRPPQTGHSRDRAAAVPGLFWRGWALRLNPTGLLDPLGYRTVLSALLLLAGTDDLSYHDALRLLGHTPTPGAYPAPTVARLRATGVLATVTAALGDLAAALDTQGSPIDFPPPPHPRARIGEMTTVLLGFAAGLLIATVTTPVGVSGAVFLLPVQLDVLHTPNPAVTPTNLLFNVLATPGALVRYRRQNQLAGPLARLLVTGTLPGVIIGAIIRVHLLPGARLFRLLLGLFLLPLGVWLCLRTLHPPTGQPTAAPQPRTITALALVVGVVGGIYGIGGGSILSPILVGRGMPVPTVAPAALAATFATSIVGAVTYAMLALTTPGTIAPHWALGLASGVGGLAGAYLGARLHRHIPHTGLRLLLGTLAVALAAVYLTQAL